MTNYKDAGVDIEMGDAVSRSAFVEAMATFISRRGMMGEPLADASGFAGLLNFGHFYLAMNCDGVGTKIELATSIDDFSGLGRDLLAMVADDAVCLGAEAIAITNTFDTDKIREDEIKKMMVSLREACVEQQVVIVGGEIAEMGTLCRGTMWNASAIGIVEKDKVIKPANVQVGDVIITLREHGLRSNGFSLVRKILRDHVSGYQERSEINNDWRAMVKQCLTPSIIYHKAIMALHGRFNQKSQVEIHGIAHITGGGIANNLRRILKANNLGARLDDIYSPPAFVAHLQEIGAVSDLDAYHAWNMGNGMMIALPENQAQKALTILNENAIEAKIAGSVTKNPTIYIKNQGLYKKVSYLEFG